MLEAAVGCGCTYPFTNKLRNTLHIAIRYLKLSLCPALTFFSLVVVLVGVVS